MLLTTPYVLLTLPGNNSVYFRVKALRKCKDFRFTDKVNTVGVKEILEFKVYQSIVCSGH